MVQLRSVSSCVAPRVRQQAQRLAWPFVHFSCPLIPCFSSSAMPILLTLTLEFFLFVTAGAARVVLTLFALHNGASATEVGVLGGLLFVFPLLLSWPVGALADRLGAHGLLMFASVCSTLSLVLPYFIHTLPAFYGAAALNGLALAFYHVTLQNS